tara:strand:- start:843 stop:3287 length:2445 start_codon:yes stop_codon:yes gene_type:complete
MAIERALDPGAVEIVDQELFGDEIEIDISMETDDGAVVIDFGSPEEGHGDIPFDANLAEYCDDSCLLEISNELVGLYMGDRNSRKDWEDVYRKGLDQLGLKIEERSTPWAGSCGVVHPVLTEAVIRFQSQSITEIFPNAGPVKTKILGRPTEAKTKQAERVQEYMNYLLTEEMREYRSETEKMLFHLPLAGSAFRKVYWDQNLGRPCSMFIPSEDLVVSYGAASLEMAERVTHVMMKSSNDIRKLQVSGFYRDIDLHSSMPDYSQITEKYNELTGESPSYVDGSMHNLLEIHCNADISGFEDMHDGEPSGIALPYVITIDKDTSQVLSIRRNWSEDDHLKNSVQHFVHYEYIPGLGFYGFGLIHMIGGIARSATSILRQLVDAGTLSNLPGGLKTRGLRIKGDDSPIMPGEFRDVDVPGGKIGDNISFIPYKEPSSVLYQLLQTIVEEGRKFASITDMKVSDMNQQAPVGTTLAIIERSMKVMNAIQSRIHYSMKQEFSILSDIVKDYMPEDYEWEVDGQEPVKREDFDGRLDIVPVSDPNSSTMAQRIMQYQAALQLAGTAPQLYDLSELHRQMLDVLGIPDADKIVPTDKDIDPLDPVSENMNILKGDPVKAALWQDHDAHIQIHMDAGEDPQLLEIIQKSPKAKSIEAALSAHVIEHLAYKYRKEIEIELGTTLPPPGKPLPPDVEVRLSQLVTEAASRLLGRDKAEGELREQMKKMEDPVIQHQKKELEIEEAKLDAKVKTDASRIAADLRKAQIKDETDRLRIKSSEFISGFEAAAKASEDSSKGERGDRDRTSREVIEGAKLGSKGQD